MARGSFRGCYTVKLARNSTRMENIKILFIYFYLLRNNKINFTMIFYFLKYAKLCRIDGRLYVKSAFSCI